MSRRILSCLVAALALACGPDPGSAPKESVQGATLGGVAGGSGSDGGSGFDGGSGTGGGSGGDGAADDGPDGTDLPDTVYEACLLYFEVFVPCFVEAGYDPDELGVDASYCDEYIGVEDPDYRDLFNCYTGFMLEADCSTEEGISAASEAAAVACEG